MGPGVASAELSLNLSLSNTHTHADTHIHTHKGEGNREGGPLYVFRTYFSSRNRKGKIDFVKFLVRARD